MGAGLPGNGAKTGRLVRQRRRAPPLPGRSAFACSRVPNSAPPLWRSAAKAYRSNRGGAAYRNPMGFSVGLKVEFLERRQVSLRMGRKLRHRVEELADGDTRPDGSGSLVKPLPRLRSYGPGPDQDPAILVGTTQPWCVIPSRVRDPVAPLGRGTYPPSTHSSGTISAASCRRRTSRRPDPRGHPDRSRVDHTVQNAN
jgi:hypothetical protein